MNWLSFTYMSCVLFWTVGFIRDIWYGAYGWAVADFLAPPIGIVRGFYYWFYMFLTF